MSSLCGPQGTRKSPLERGRHSHRLKTSAAHRSAAMAGGARPDPFRTRKLSRRAPMVLRGQPVGEQGAADRWTALDPYQAGSGAGAPRGHPLRGAPFFLPISFSRGPSGALFSWAASCLVCRSARTGRASFRPRGSSALRPIHLARPPAVLSRPGPFLRLSGPCPVRWALVRFLSCKGEGHEVIGP